MRRLTEIPRRYPGAVAAIGLFALPLAVLGWALLPGKVMSAADIVLTFYPWAAAAPGVTAKNPFLFDVIVFHAWLIYAAREIWAGQFPLWNPHVFAGVPFFANSQAALLFPLNALAYLLPIPTALTLISILKFSVAGLSMYWFLRMLPVGRFPAVIGAVAFMFNGALVVWLQYPFGSAISILPLLFGMTERLCTRRDLRSAAGLAIVVALEIFAGYPPVAVQGLAAAAAWALYRVGGIRRRLTALASVSGAAVLGCALAAVQILPFLEYARASSVVHYRSQWMPDLAPPFRTAITLLMPYYYGSPTGDDFWGYLNFNESTASVGLVPWVVLPAALLAGWSQVGTKFLFGLAGLSGAVFYALPILGPALATVPLVSLVRAQRAAGLFAFALSALCAIGLDALTRVQPGRLRAAGTGVKAGFVALVSVAFLFLVSDYPSSSRIVMKVPVVVQYVLFVLLLMAATLPVLRLVRSMDPPPSVHVRLVLVQLASTLPLVLTYNPVIDARLLFPEPPPAVRYLQSQTRTDPGRVSLGLAMNMGMLYGLLEVSGYDGMTPRRLEELVNPSPDRVVLGAEAVNITTGVESPVFDLVGIRRVVFSPRAPRPAPHFTLEYDGRDGRVYRNERALPRAFIVPQAVPCVDDATALRLMRAGRINLREEVLIHTCDRIPAAGARPGIAEAEVLQSPSDRVRIRAVTDSPAYLVLTDTWFPGWRAWVNGAEHPVWRANYAFRAVWLPAGRHEIEFRYRPASFQYGLWLSALAACVSVGLCLVPTRRRD